MKLIVGLGNPGSQYESTRHNLGFLAVQQLAQELKVKFVPSRCCKGLEASFEIEGHEVKLLLPMTFMNLSGRAAKPFIVNYDVALNDMLVVYDDFHLDSLSIAEGIGVPIKFPIPIAIDLEGRLRDITNPDAGCLEREE